MSAGESGADALPSTAISYDGVFRPDARPGRSTAASSSSTVRITTAALVALAGLLTTAFFFRYQILNRFTLLTGNRYDQVIEVTILEHWFNTFRGLAHWSEMGYFYPVGKSLGYNDGFFLYGVFYSVFRAARIDPFLSGELVNVALKLIGFFGFYLAARRLLDLRPGWAILSSILFTLSNNAFIQSHHAQLLGVAFAPVMAVLLDETVAALLSGRRRHLLAWGAAAGCLYAAWLTTTYYVAWYFAFFGTFLCGAYALVAGPTELRVWWTAIRRNAAPLAAVGLIFLVATIPFLSVYLTKAHETGMHSYREAQIHTLTLPDLMDVGSGNLLYGRIVAFVNHAIRPNYPAWTERISGFPPVLLLLFACGCLVSLAAPRTIMPSRPNLLRATAIATLATWVLAFNVDGHSAWWFVYKLFPGAKATRVVARYQIFVTVPVVSIAILYLSASARKIVAPVLALVCVLLVAEQINTSPFMMLDRAHELAHLDAVPPPPADCKAFFTSSARPEPVLDDPDLEDFYNHNVDAMFIAEMVHLPTINGAATFHPTNWNLVAPGKPGYLDKVLRYAAAHHVTQLCSLDLKTLQWSHMQLAGSP